MQYSHYNLIQAWVTLTAGLAVNTFLKHVSLLVYRDVPTDICCQRELVATCDQM